MKRDASRGAALIRRTEASEYEEEKLGAEVISGGEFGSFEYLVRIGVGTPPINQYMVMETGGDLLWVQCKPCDQCYQQVFDPSLSTSFANLPCSSTICVQGSLVCDMGECKYDATHYDGSYSKGKLALETFTFGDTVVQNVAFGCGHSNRKMITGDVSGVLGLGGGAMWVVSQLS